MQPTTFIADRFIRNVAVVRDLLGGRTRLTPHDILLLFSHRLSLTYFALIACAFFAADPPNLRDHLPYHLVALTWVVAGTCFILFYLFYIIFITIFLPRIAERFLLTPILCVASLIPTMILGEHLAHALSGGSYPLNGIDRFLFFYVTSFVFGEVYFQFVAPLIHLREAAQGPKKPPETPGDTDRTILVCSERLPISELTAIESQQHFVAIRLHGQTMTFRARLSDIVAQTSDHEGIQPHRSWWVARNAAPQLEMTDDGRPILRLRDDTLVPVARARLNAVRDWLGHNRAA